jgi:hypothetical protein
VAKIFWLIPFLYGIFSIIEGLTVIRAREYVYVRSVNLIHKTEKKYRTGKSSIVFGGSKILAEFVAIVFCGIGLFSDQVSDVIAYLFLLLISVWILQMIGLLLSEAVFQSKHN